MLRSDTLGVTSVIRDLSLNSRCYETLIHFFPSSSWSTQGLRQKWLQVVRHHAPLLVIQNRVVLVGDGMKQAKESRRMPGVKKHHQESENVSKGDYIFGHLFGAIGILVGDSRKGFCLPLFMNLQDFFQTLLGWKKSKGEGETPSHVVQMIEHGFETAKGFGQALLLLDRYFLSVPALERLNACHLASETRMHLVTKAKSKVVAYERPPAKKPGRGPKKRGQAVKLKELFNSRLERLISKPHSFRCTAKKRRFSFCAWICFGAGLVSGITLCSRGTCMPLLHSGQH
ncbi:hypothetical protein D3C76_889250 [compost metagenome]